MAQLTATYTQYRTFSHLYLFKSKSDQSLTLKIFNQAREKLLVMAAPALHVSEWSKVEHPRTLLNLFVENNLITPALIPSTPVVNHIHELQKLIRYARTKVSIEPEHMKKFTCSITLNFFEKPVTLICGHTFEYQDLLDHLQKNPTCPLCRVPIDIDSGSLKTNFIIKDAIDEWKQEDPIPTLARFKGHTPVLCGKNLELAQVNANLEKYDDAIKSYSKAFEYTNNWRNYQELPKLYEQINRLDEATLAYLYLALYQYQDEELKKALETLEHCKKINPSFQQINNLLIQLYYANQQIDQAIQLALDYAQASAKTTPQEAIRLYQQLLTYDPCKWSAYRSLANLLQDPQEKAHILLKGAIHALEAKEYQIVQNLSQEAEKQDEDSFVDRLIDIEFLQKQTPSLLKEKLLILAKRYEQKNLIAPMTKVHKLLSHLDIAVAGPVENIKPPIERALAPIVFIKEQQPHTRGRPHFIYNESLASPTFPETDIRPVKNIKEANPRGFWQSTKDLFK